MASRDRDLPVLDLAIESLEEDSVLTGQQEVFVTPVEVQRIFKDFGNVVDVMFSLSEM